MADEGDHRGPKMIKAIIDVRMSQLAIEDGRMIIFERRMRSEGDTDDERASC